MSRSEEHARPLELLREASEFFTTRSCVEVDYRRVVEDLEKLSGASFVAFNEVSEDQEYTVTRAVSGSTEQLLKAAKVLGFRIIGASYRIDDPVASLFSQDAVVDLGSLCEATGFQLPKALCTSLSKLFGIDRVYGLGLKTKNGALATIMFLMKGDREPRNGSYIRIYGNFISVCMERQLAENDYLSRLFELEEERGGGVDSALIALHRAAETVPDILYQLDTEGNIVFINQAIKRYGYERDELIGKSILDVVHPDDREKARHRLQERRTGARRTLNFEVRLLSNSRRTNYFTFHTRPLPDAPIVSIKAEGIYRGEVTHDNYIGTIGIGHDITEKKLMECEIAEREEVFRHIAESVGEAIWLEERNPLRLLYVNPAFRRLFCMDEHALQETGEEWLEKVHPEDRETVRSSVENESGTDGYLEYRLLDPENEQKWIRSRILPLQKQDSPSSPRYVGIAVDVSDEKEEQRELEKRLAAGEAFVRELNHRVKNNLAMLDSMLNLQEQRLRSVKDYSSLILEMKSRLRAVGLVHEMLYRANEQRHIDISSYLHNLGDNILSSGLDNPGRIDILYTLPSVKLKIDTVIPLGMIFSELMTNVVKYAFPENRSGTVRVELLAIDEGKYQLTVTDDGVGLPADYEERKGDSIGHLLVSSLAEQIDGDFFVSSEEGKTQFGVRFLVHSEEA